MRTWLVPASGTPYTQGGSTRRTAIRTAPEDVVKCTVPGVTARTASASVDMLRWLTALDAGSSAIAAAFCTSRKSTATIAPADPFTLP